MQSGSLGSGAPAMGVLPRRACCGDRASHSPGSSPPCDHKNTPADQQGLWGGHGVCQGSEGARTMPVLESVLAVPSRATDKSDVLR